MSTTQRQRLEAREENLLVAATAVFAESGVDGARMAEIARRADIAEGTIYLYHKNKQELLEAVVDRFWRELTRGALAALSPHGSVTQQLKELANYHLHSLIDDFKIVEITSRASERQGETGRQFPQIREYVRVFDAILARGIGLQDFAASTPVWPIRDVVYGTLQHPPRTPVLRTPPFDASVTTHLLLLFERFRQTTPGVEGQTKTETSIMEALARIESHLTTKRS